MDNRTEEEAYNVVKDSLSKMEDAIMEAESDNPDQHPARNREFDSSKMTDDLHGRSRRDKDISYKDRKRSRSPISIKDRIKFPGNRRKDSYRRSRSRSPRRTSRHRYGKRRRYSKSPENFHDSENEAGYRVYVGNLSYEVRTDDLWDLMEDRIGEVKDAQVLKNLNGQSKGCGVVEFYDKRNVEKAIDKLTDYNFLGRPIFVREDREKPSINREKLYSIFVGNLSYRTDWRDLKDLFRDSAPVIRADIFKDSRGKSKGCGIVAFKSQSDAMKAIDEFDGFMFQGRKIDVREDRK